MGDSFSRMMKLTFRGLFILLGGIVGYQLSIYILPQLPPDWFPWAIRFIPLEIGFMIFSVIFFGAVGFVLTPLVLKGLGFIGSLFERQLQTTSWQDITAATMGLIIGLLVANLIALPFSDLPFGSYIAVFLNIVLGYLGARLVLKRQQDLRGVFLPIKGIKERLQNLKGKHGTDLKHTHMGTFTYEASKKVLDTSVIIDGRILDIARTGFLEGYLILPRFILIELQAVADSTDPARRTRGRRGLDVVNALQNIDGLNIEIVEESLKDLNVGSVDEALVEMALKIGADILTTDYNLNKIAQIQGLKVLNVNDLANALKPMLLPGETITVDIIREGKELHQGVGYLDDGTMLVVEDGENFIGKRVEVVVTSMLQTSAGRMVFGKIRKEVRS
ncbi:MAG: TRAM domain-containing protein [Synergistales bacterium]|nr:TRAM domain-containing protein [Synergistales bacterium]